MLKKISWLLVVMFSIIYFGIMPASADTTPYRLDPKSSPEEKMESYRTLVQKKLQQESFFTEVEEILYESEGYYVHNFWLGEYSSLYHETYEKFYPVIYNWADDNWIIYTDKSGYCCYEKLDGSLYAGNTVGSLHNPANYDGGYLIKATRDYSLIGFKEEGKVKLYQFGKVVETFDVPKDAIFAGESFWIGFIFRKDSDVYALDIYGNTGNGSIPDGGSAVCIAHDVSFVISADYKFSSDCWSQPLFLMNDGSLKAYLWSYPGQDIAPDDESHFREVTKDGGYF